MVDVARSYRRWRLRHLLILGPLFACALGSNLWFAIGAEETPWLRIVSLTVSALCLVGLGSLVVQTVLCASLHTRGERRSARTLRGQIASHARVAALCVLVLAVLLVAPVFFPSPLDRPTRFARRHPRIEIPTVEPDFTQVTPQIAAVDLPAPPPPAPQILPVIADVPSRLEFEERELDWPVAAAPFLDPGRENTGPSPTPDTELPSFRPDPTALELRTMEAVDRLYLPGEADADALPPPSFRLEFLILSMEGYGRGGGARLEADLPLHPSGSLTAEYAVVAFTSGEIADLLTDWSWQHVIVAYRHRLLGHTRRATFDLAAAVGLSLDRFLSGDAAVDRVGSDSRVSPYAAVDLGLWHGGAVGVLLHAGQAFPLGVTGSTASVTDLSSLIRLDVSERLSLYAGYQLVYVKLKEFDAGFKRERGLEEFDASLAGPVVGLELRF